LFIENKKTNQISFFFVITFFFFFFFIIFFFFFFVIKIEYDPITIPKDGYKDNIENLFYNNVDGKLQPKYTVLVFPNGRVSYKNGKTWKSAITDEQWLQIEGYARTNDARLVFLNEYPSTATGTKLYKECSGESDCKFDLTHKVIADKNIVLAETVNEVNLVVDKK